MSSQICTPFPERERSIAAKTPNWSQVSKKALASSGQFCLSKDLSLKIIITAKLKAWDKVPVPLSHFKQLAISQVKPFIVKV